jgi:hypothetical protein
MAITPDAIMEAAKEVSSAINVPSIWVIALQLFSGIVGAVVAASLAIYISNKKQMDIEQDRRKKIRSLIVIEINTIRRYIEKCIESYPKNTHLPFSDISERSWMCNNYIKLGEDVRFFSETEIEEIGKIYASFLAIVTTRDPQSREKLALKKDLQAVIENNPRINSVE